MRHLIATAAGWGGNPDKDATYLNFTPSNNGGDTIYKLKVKDVPVDDGSVDIQFGGCDGKIPNCLPILPGWNYTVRLYRPRAESLDGTWKFPEAQPAI